MSEKELRDELINYVVKSTQHVIMIDPETLMPSSGGSGLLLIYKERLFFVSVQHVTDKAGKQAALDTGIGDENGTNLYSLPALNFIDQFSVEGLDIGQPVLKKLKSLDICYTEIKDSIEIKQTLKKFGDTVVTADLKRMIYTDLDYEPTFEEGYCFHGRIRGELEDNTLNQIDKLVLGMKYDGKIGPFERFILEEEVVSELDYQGTSGAPIFSETGEPVALVAYGYIGEKYLYGFSMRELRKYLDIYILLDSINNPTAEEGAVELTHEELSKFEREKMETELGSLFHNFGNDFGITTHIKNIISTEYISYPVLYGTNRKYEIKNKKIAYKNKRDASLHTGICEISIPLSHRVGELERPDWFTSLFFNDSPEKYFTILTNELLDKDAFTEILAEKIGKSDQNDILLFIHGYNVDFKEAMYRTAQLGYDLNFKGGVTAFSWPSEATVTGYAADTDTAALSSNYLCDFIKILLETKDLKKIHIIAHSMGNVVLTNALVKLKNENLFPNTLINQIILAAPDIDKDIFISQLMPEINRNFGLTLYASDKDKALIASKRIRSGYIRLGEGGDNIVIAEGLDSIDASRVDTSLLGHGYFADTQTLLNDIHMTLLGIPPTNRILDSKSKIIEGTTKSYWVFRNS
ncbi:alpha/beta hydrolase [Flavobacterium johnsoniae]|uniref:alpha/beta hydrolase n=1 Tax=Flavobacterium johnsoniae TaxID=986 RepID=UPI0025B103B8|nr:alpha/beta hydrolase [Flavobacterium johnsoniae]WJS96799.1 alpha/beta hydrolase [Flavobacterium johnsoniae]